MIFWLCPMSSLSSSLSQVEFLFFIAAKNAARKEEAGECI